MTEKERTIRETCYAKILFLEENIPGYVKDISATGCRIDIPSAVRWEAGQRKSIIIIPEEPLPIEPIKGVVEIRWIKQVDMFFKCGMHVISVNDEASKENYAKLLAYYSKHA